MPQATMTIIVEDDGSVSVNGPLDNPLLFHGMIGVAADILSEYQRQKAKDGGKKVVLAQGPLPTLGK